VDAWRTITLDEPLTALLRHKSASVCSIRLGYQLGLLPAYVLD
jgi:hypothetical protein